MGNNNVVSTAAFQFFQFFYVFRVEGAALDAIAHAGYGFFRRHFHRFIDRGLKSLVVW